MSASEHRYLIEIGKPLLDIHNKYLIRAFSSEGVKYCWRLAFSCLEGRPYTWYHRVVGGTLMDFDRAAYVLGSVGSSLHIARHLAGSILQMVMVMVMVMVKGNERRAALGSRLGGHVAGSYRYFWDLRNVVSHRYRFIK